MDCQKLSREACAHAAQNDRLPVQTVVQVLYHEQQRLRDVMNGSGDSPAVIPSKVNLYTTDVHPVSGELSSLKRENQDLKLELVKMKMRLKEIEKSTSAKTAVSNPMGSITPSSDKPPLPKKSFMNSVSKKLGRLYPFVPSSAKGRTRPSKDRRHSISWHHIALPKNHYYFFLRGKLFSVCVTCKARENLERSPLFYFMGYLSISASSVYYCCK